MSRRWQTGWRWMAGATLVAVLAWAAVASVELVRARRANVAVADVISRQIGPGEHSSLLALFAVSLRRGDLRMAYSLLRPRPLSASDKDAARRTLAGLPAIRKRIVAAVEESQQREKNGHEVSAIRAVLTTALRAAARGDIARLEECLAQVERALDELAPRQQKLAGPAARDRVLALAATVGPVLSLGREVLLEGLAPAERLAAGAAACFRREQYDQAAVLLELAAALLAVPATEVSPPATVPDWLAPEKVSGTVFRNGPEGASQKRFLTPFPGREQSPEEVSPQRVRAVVAFCRTVAEAQSPATPVQWIARRAERDLARGDSAQAYWWATVALEAMGVSQEAVAAADEEAKPAP